VLDDRLQVFCKDLETFWADIAAVGNRATCRPTLNRQIKSAIYVEKETTNLRTNMVVVVSTGSACVVLNWIMSHKAVRRALSCIVTMNGEVVGNGSLWMECGCGLVCDA
jgi:hypothetical protein